MAHEDLEAARRKAAEREWQGYDFEEHEIEGPGSWEETKPGEITRRVFVSSGTDAPSELADFHVRFVPGTSEVAEAYASLAGNDIGRSTGADTPAITKLAVDGGHEPPPPTYRVTLPDGTVRSGLLRRDAALAMLTAGGRRPEIRGGAGHDTAARYDLWLVGPDGEEHTGISVMAHGPTEAYEQAVFDAANYKLNGGSVAAEVAPAPAGAL